MKKNNNIPPMTRIEPLRHPFSGEAYESQMYDNCVQAEFNKDGSVDLYDYNSGKHLERINDGVKKEK